jgi:hypothetical protein
MNYCLYSNVTIVVFNDKEIDKRNENIIFTMNRLSIYMSLDYTLYLEMYFNTGAIYIFISSIKVYENNKINETVIIIYYHTLIVI